MTADQYAKIKKIFLEACAQPSEDRSAFLARACAGNEPFLREVERLLAHHVIAPPTIGADKPAHRPNEKGLATDISEWPTFQTGDVIADRYRVVSLLGEGAMGRVYRAEDIRLRQDVALKFLPRLHVLDPLWRHRVECEVKLSREVGHSNICRVYDLGEVDGSPYISMEYIDGEDLASLLRRVGRLTGARAIDIARQLCAGLAAAHIHGVLHRDLKPANVMIDQKGRVRITDFGLAVMTGQVERGEIRAGTPRYMAPEQLAGVSVDEKSDIYSLGLVLYEMFTGCPAFDADNVLEYYRLHQAVEPRPPSEIVPEIDPAVEAVIMACLRKNPAERPDSALTVAAALPGGDLLAAALDAGQIPTREMLATAAAQGGISRRGMYRFAAAALFLFVGAIVLGNNTHPVAKYGVKSPEFLFEKAREVTRMAGHNPASQNTIGRYVPVADAGFLGFAATGPDKKLALAIPSDDGLLYYYRDVYTNIQSAGGSILSFVMPASSPLFLDSESAPSTTSILDGQGRLLSFESNANHVSDPQAPIAPADWPSMIRASGYDPRLLAPATPRLIPEIPADEHLAFLARSGLSMDRDVRIEIVMHRQRVALYAVLFESPPPAPPSVVFSAQFRWTTIQTLRNTVLLGLLAVAIPGAWKNWRGGGDLVGAARLGGFVFALRLVSRLLSIRGAGGYSETTEMLANSAAGAVCEGTIVALFYLAIEAQIRRLWPRTLGGWCRLLVGRLRDPFVGRDLLVGCVVGNFWAILAFLDRRLPGWMGWEARTQLRIYQGLDDVLDARSAIAGVLNTLRTGIYQGLAMLLLLVIVTWLAGSRRWLAMILAWFIGAIMYVPAASHPVTAWTLFAIGLVPVGLYLVIRWGLVSLLAALVVAGLLIVFPITTDFHAWYAGYGLFACAAALSLGLWSLFESLRRPALDCRPSILP